MAETIMKVFLGGEGPNELGGWATEPVHRDSRPWPGVLEALLIRVDPHAFEVINGVTWKQIRKFRAGGALRGCGGDCRNVLGLALRAREADADVVCFARDRDGDNQREADFNEGLRQISEKFASVPAVIGGMAIEMLEAWILALCNVSNSESHRHPEVELRQQKGIDKDTAAMVQIVEDADLTRIPHDANSLWSWIAQARAVADSAGH